MCCVSCGGGDSGGGGSCSCSGGGGGVVKCKKVPKVVSLIKNPRQMGCEKPANLAEQILMDRRGRKFDF